MNGTIEAPVLVLGATGIVGRGIVGAAVEAGRPVIAVAADRRELEQLRAAHAAADLTTLVGSLASDADGAELAASVLALRRPLIGVVAALAGAPARGRLLDHPAETLQHQLEHDLLPHLIGARHLLPLLAIAGGSYVLIGGPGSEQPWAGYGHRSVAAAAQRMLARVLHEEAQALAVRVQLLTVDLPVCDEHDRLHACPQWPSAIDVGHRAIALIERRDATDVPAAVVPYAARTRRLATLSTGSPDAATATPPSAADPSLPARCLLDARRLLQTFIPLHPRSPNQESSP